MVFASIFGTLSDLHSKMFEQRWEVFPDLVRKTIQRALKGDQAFTCVEQAGRQAHSMARRAHIERALNILLYCYFVCQASGIVLCEVSYWPFDKKLA